MLRIKKILAITLISIFLSGCHREISEKKEFILMDTFVVIQIEDSLKRDFKDNVIRKVMERMKELEQEFSYYSENGELARINNLKKGKKMVLSDEMLSVLKFAKDLCVKTDRAFDVTLGRGSWMLDINKKTISLKKDSVKLDLGGIAKGYIVDEGIRVLRDLGVNNAIINAGGDLYCMGGGPYGYGWKIGVKDPVNQHNIIASFIVRNKGVATSGNYERPNHIIDPRKKIPVSVSGRSVTVIADDCMTADGLATALYVMGPEDGISFIEGIDGVECLIVEDGKCNTSSGWDRAVSEFTYSEESSAANK